MLTTPAPAGPVHRPRRRSPRGRTGRLVGQAAVVSGGFALYSAVRGFAGTDPTPALDHARDIVALERRLGLFHEPRLQEAVVDHDWVLDVLNSVYVWAHWPLIAVVLLWMLLSHPREFAVLRDALVVSCVIALVVYSLYPVAPPRLAGLGLLDSVTERSTAYRVLQPPSFVNQYAAMPSMHMGWDLLMAMTVVAHARHRVARLVGWLLVPAMAAAVVLTANHWFLDVVGGFAAALAGLWVARRLQARRLAAVARVPAPRLPT